jgi:hypothetical protein
MPYRLIDPTTHPRVRSFLHVVAGTATGLLIVGVLFLLVQTSSLAGLIRETQVAAQQRSLDTRSAAESAARGTERIEACTTPGRDCFQESQRRLAKAISNINDYATYAAACADKPRQQTARQIRACIVAQIADDRRRRDR